MLKSKTILITGGGSGIGLSFVRNLSKNNRIIICGRNEEKLKKVCEEYSNVFYYVADISVAESIDMLFEKIKADGFVPDVLINNAGIIERWDINETAFSSHQIFEKINTNLSGAIAITQKFIIQADKSSNNIIINITAGIAIFPVPIFALYATSKTGLSVFTKILRQQLKRTNFKVIEVLPPNVETDMPKKVGNTVQGINADDFVKKTISKINSGTTEYAPGFIVWILKFFSKFSPKFGLNLIDKMSRKQFESK